MSSITAQIAEAVKSVGVHTVYGESREIEGSTVVPVAVVGYGFGGGGSDDEGEGGGGGGYAWPVGAYVADGLGVEFKPNPVALLVIGIPFVWVAGHALARIIKALKK